MRLGLTAAIKQKYHQTVLPHVCVTRFTFQFGLAATMQASPPGDPPLKQLLLSSAMFAIMACGSAQAFAVYPGCAAPVAKNPHRTFYVDPAKGSKSGDGSAAKPWRTLAEVLDRNSSLVATQGHNTRTWAKGDTGLVAVNPAGPIKPGDVIMLMSGNHGSLAIQNNYNSDYITVMAAPGQTPVVSRLAIISSGKWAFQGIKFQGMPASKSNDGIVSIGAGDWLGATSNIIVDNSSMSATDDTSGWSDSDWMTKPYGYGLAMAPGSSCVSATNNHLYNVLNGLQVAGSSDLVQGNLIEKMSNDGIDLMASNVTVKGNTIQDGRNNAQTSPLHADGIQGWSLSTNGKVNVNTNIVIDSNSIVKTGSANTSYMQGITIFDGLWNKVSITNNVVVSNNFQGISLYGVDNATVVNNTLIGADPAHLSWIIVTKSKAGLVPKNNIVRNNIAPTLQIMTGGVTADHNIVSSQLVMTNAGNSLSRLSSGAFGTNKIVPNIMSQFITLNNGNGTYDLRPKSDSAALSFGVAASAPLVDIVGKARKPSVTAGAYN